MEEPEKGLLQRWLRSDTGMSEGGCPHENLRKDIPERGTSKGKGPEVGHLGTSQEQHGDQNGWRGRAVGEEAGGWSRRTLWVIQELEFYSRCDVSPWRF